MEVATKKDLAAALKRIEQLERVIAQVLNQPLALEWLPEPEAGAFLRRSRGTLREYARQGKIRCEKRGGRVLYHVESMRAFLQNKNFSHQFIEQSLKDITTAA